MRCGKSGTAPGRCPETRRSAPADTAGAGSRPGRRRPRLQRLVQLVEQVVEGQHALRGLACRQLLVELTIRRPPAGRSGAARPVAALASSASHSPCRASASGLSGASRPSCWPCAAAVAGQSLHGSALAEQGGCVAEVAIQLGLPGIASLVGIAHIALEAVERLQLLQPGRAAALPEVLGLLPDGAQRRQLSCAARLRLDAQVGLAQVAAQALTQLLRGEFLLHQEGRPFRLGAGQFMAPEVGEQRVEDLAVVAGSARCRNRHRPRRRHPAGRAGRSRGW
jgi:hypothetical protein